MYFLPCVFIQKAFVSFVVSIPYFSFPFIVRVVKLLLLFHNEIFKVQFLWVCYSYFILFILWYLSEINTKQPVITTKYVLSLLFHTFIEMVTAPVGFKLKTSASISTSILHFVWQWFLFCQSCQLIFKFRWSSFNPFIGTHCCPSGGAKKALDINGHLIEIQKRC